MPACFFALAKFMFIHYNASLFRFQRLLLYGIVVTMKENNINNRYIMKDRKEEYIRNIVLFVFVLLIGCLSISSHSLWMDEALRVGYSNISVEDGYFERSWINLHVGLVHYMYAWGQLFGTSEVAFRAMNLPFLMIAAVYMVKMLRSFGVSSWWVLLFVAHPLTVYYMNDAGPYIALMGCACAVTYHSLLAKNLNSLWNTAAIFAWMLLGFSMHFTFGFVGVIYLYSLALRLYRGRKWSIFLRDCAVAIPFIPALLYVAWMYLVNMPDGKQIGMEPPGVLNIATVGYCFSGLAGLGIPRNDMKSAGVLAITPVMISLVSVFCVSLLVLLTTNLRFLWQQIKRNHVLFATSAVAVLFFVGSFIKGFRFWERHVIFLFPVFFLLLAIIFQRACRKRGSWVSRIAFVLIAGLLLTSSSRLRWYEPYRKDDYKSMILHLKEEGLLNGSIPVLAQGDFWVYNYYGISFAEENLVIYPDCVCGVMKVSAERLLHMVDEISRYHGRICLILHQQKSKTPQLYQNAEAVFKQKGYNVTCNSQFNTFKVLTLERALR